MLVLRKEELQIPASSQIREKDVLDYFSTFGKIKLMNWIRDKVTKNVKGYGFVTFHETGPFDEVLKRRHHVLNGRQVEVFAASQRQESFTFQKRRIAVKLQTCLEGEMAIKGVQDYFSAFGEIEHVDATKLQTKGLVTVTFKNEESVAPVLSNKPHKINGEMILVSQTFSSRQWRQRRLEKKVNEVKSTQAEEKKENQIIIKIPNKFKDNITEESLEQYFSSYGEIEQAFILRNEPKMESRGLGFVSFKDSRDAEGVLTNKKHKIGNAEFYAERSLTTHEKAQNIPRYPKKIFDVSNISQQTSKQDIWEYFSKFGKVAEVVFAKKPYTSERTDTCVITFDSIKGGNTSLADKHHISTQEDMLVVKSRDTASLWEAKKILVDNIPEDLTLEMLQDYFGTFGAIRYLGFTSYHAEQKGSTSIGASVAFHDKEAIEKALNKPVHEINGCKVQVKRATRWFAGKPSDYRSLGVLISDLPADVDESVIKDFLMTAQSCKVKSVRFLSQAACVAQMQNLNDVNKLVKMATEVGHFIDGKPISLRRFRWVSEQDEEMKLHNMQ